MERILPAYPLWVIDPLFSVWAKTEALNGDDTVFWTGQSKRACGFVRWNGKTYCFMGRYGGALPLEQTDVRVSAFSTDYTFRGEGFTLGVRFVSPLLPDDLKTLACPVCYTDYEVRAEGELPADFSVALMLDEEFCYNGERAAVAGGVLPLKGTKPRTSRVRATSCFRIRATSARPIGGIYTSPPKRAGSSANRRSTATCGMAKRRTCAKTANGSACSA